MSLGDGSFYDSLMFDLSQLASLSLLEIGSDCFGLADSFDLDGLNQLASVSIGDGSFKNSTSFSLSNLNSFELLEIGNECFSNVGSFELNGLNALKTLKIGQNSFTLNKNDYGETHSHSIRMIMERMKIDLSTLQTALPSNQSISASSVLVIMQAVSN